MDDYIAEGDFENAKSRGIQAIHVYDEEREFENSISILEKLIEIAEIQHNTIEIMRFVDNLKARALLTRNKKKYAEVSKIYSNTPVTPLSKFFEKNIVKEDKPFIIENLDIQSIFGDFEIVPNIPDVFFKSADDAIRVVEDYFEPGRYLLNLLNISTSLHQAINLDVGDPEEFNVVDRTHTFRIS